jgi:hypothetical protein
MINTWYKARKDIAVVLSDFGQRKKSGCGPFDFLQTTGWLQHRHESHRGKTRELPGMRNCRAIYQV